MDKVTQAQQYLEDAQDTLNRAEVDGAPEGVLEALRNAVAEADRDLFRAIDEADAEAAAELTL